MNTQEIVNEIVDRTGLTERVVRRVLARFFDVVGEEVAAGHTVLIQGQVKFEPVDRPARTGRNPRTGATVEIEARRSIKIKPMATLKAAVNGR